MKILIGIDPGVNTGLAVSKDGKLTRVDSVKIHEAMEYLRMLTLCVNQKTLKVFIEDARKRGCDPKTAAVKAQGAGSVKRDCKIWEDFLIDSGINFVLVPPQQNNTKLTADQFKKITKWQGRTNEHARDAAMLIFKR